MQRDRLLGLLTVPALLVSLAGCSAPVKEQPRAGFISDYTRLEKTASQQYTYVSPKIRNYDSFIIERPVLLFSRSADERKRRFTDEEIEDLMQYFNKRATRSLTENDGYSVSDEPGPGVARIRLGFTALDASVGVLNVWLYTKLAGVGLGGAALEAEIVDSLSGEQLAASVQWGNGSRLLRAGFTKMGDAKLQIKYWTKRLRKRLDAINGRDQRAAKERR